MTTRDETISLIVGELLPTIEAVRRDPETFRSLLFPNTIHVTKAGHIYPPVLAGVASRNRVHLIVWCKFCDGEHAHGFGTGGGRVCHCWISNSPYRTGGGYLIVPCQGRPADLKPPRSERRRPRTQGWVEVHGWDSFEVELPRLVSQEGGI